MFLGFTNPIFGNKANKVSLIYKDNTQKKGLLSTFTGVDDKVKFRTDEKAKVEKIKVSLLKYIIIENEEDKTLDTFHIIKVGFYMFSKLKIYDTEYIAFRVYNSNKVEGFVVNYSEVDHYAAMNLTKSSSNRMLLTRLPGQDYMVQLSEEMSGYVGIGINKLMRNNFKKEIESICPAMVNKIDEKDYKIADFLTMLEDYSALCP
jgi:hypothetical protein